MIITLFASFCCNCYNFQIILRAIKHYIVKTLTDRLLFRWRYSGAGNKDGVQAASLWARRLDGPPPHSLRSLASRCPKQTTALAQMSSRDVLLPPALSTSLPLAAHSNTKFGINNRIETIPCFEHGYLQSRMTELQGNVFMDESISV